MHIVNPCFIKKAFFFLRILLKIDVSDRTDSFCRYPANCNINFWCRCSASAAIQLRKLVVRSTKSPPERSKPLCGENLKYQVRELRRNPLWSYAVPSALGTSFLVR